MGKVDRERVKLLNCWVKDGFSDKKAGYLQRIILNLEHS